MSPTTGSLNFSPWNALMIRTSQRTRVTRPINNESRPTNGMMNARKERTICTTKIPPKAMFDCIAWNLTVLFSFSTRKKMIPVMNPSTYVNADAMFSSRPKVAFSIFFTPEMLGECIHLKAINRLLSESLHQKSANFSRTII